ncbi:MAG: hypothetical protein QXV83_01755 [Candidatus Anstonellaceae archaeon]
MYDLIRFKADKEHEKETKMQLVCLESLPKNYFGIFYDLNQLKTQLKKYRIINVPTYQMDEALARSISANNIIFAVNLSDFFLNEKKEICKRLIRLKRCLKILKKYNCEVRFFTLARNFLELRNCYEIMLIANYFKFDSNYLKKIYGEKLKE